MSNLKTQYSQNYSETKNIGNPEVHWPLKQKNSSGSFEDLSRNNNVESVIGVVQDDGCQYTGKRINQEISNSTLLNNVISGSSTFAISGWFKLQSFDGTQPVIYSNTNASTVSKQLYLYTNSTLITTAVGDGVRIFNVSPRLNAWNHFLFEKTSNAAGSHTLYINGKSCTSNAQNAAVATPEDLGGFAIGKYYADTSKNPRAFHKNYRIYKSIGNSAIDLYLEEYNVNSLTKIDNMSETITDISKSYQSIGDSDWKLSEGGWSITLNKELTCTAEGTIYQNYSENCGTIETTIQCEDLGVVCVGFSSLNKSVYAIGQNSYYVKVASNTLAICKSVNGSETILVTSDVVIDSDKQYDIRFVWETDGALSIFFKQSNVATNWVRACLTVDIAITSCRFCVIYSTANNKLTKNIIINEIALNQSYPEDFVWITSVNAIQFITEFNAPSPHAYIWGNGVSTELNSTGETQNYSYGSTGFRKVFARISEPQKLLQFRCSANQLTGSIPDLSKFVNISQFLCQTNALTGVIPSLALNTSLQYFYCHQNQLVGNITDLSNNPAMIIFYCQQNQISGVIPNLTSNINLEQFWCHTNKLSGTIPSLTANPKLTQFLCYGNAISGTIPDLSNNKILSSFSCYTNKLSGTIPSLTENIELSTFYCYDNAISGTIPDLSNNTKLTQFWCHTNKLSGTIPSLATNLLLTQFRCQLNPDLTGQIPSLLGNIALQQFWANNCSITGYIPQLPASIRQFYASTNQISGTIPSLATNTLLQQYWVGGNAISGTIPDLSNNTALTQFRCNDNFITHYTGSAIPTSITTFNALNNLLSSGSVDQILAHFEVNVGSRPNTVTIDLSGTGNEPPSPAGFTSRNNLLAAKPLWTINVNSPPV